MTTATPAYRLRSFQGAMLTLEVDGDQHIVVAMANRVSFIDVRVWGREEFEAEYAPAEVSDQTVWLAQQQFVGYSRSVGCTPRAAVYLKKLGLMQGADLHGALTKGGETLARIQKEAKIMEATDKDPTAGKAPRKLAGAALAAAQRKEQRLAAEAKQLAGEVSKDQAQAEEAGTVDATLPKAAPKPAGKKGSTKQAVQAAVDKKKKAEPKVTKQTPSAAQAKKILKGSARSDAQVSVDGEFDPAKLRNAAGEYRSASAMFKGLLFEGKLSDEKIAEAVDKQFQLGADKAKDYVKWNRGWFRRQGVTIAAAK